MGFTRVSETWKRDFGFKLPVLCFTPFFCYNDACHVTDIGVTSEVGGKIDKIRLGDLG
jgi:hypothetical protein